MNFDIIYKDVTGSTNDDVWDLANHGAHPGVAVRALRQKLESDPAAPELIVNEPAVGYRLVG